MLAALLLCAAVGMGLSRDYERVLYGQGFKIKLLSRAHTLTVWSGPDDVRILWTSENLPVGHDPRHSVDVGYFVMSQMTQRDNGRYDLWDKDDHRLFSVAISVVAEEKNYDVSVGGDVSFKSNLPFTTCNVLFTPEDQSDSVEVVRRGRVKNRDRCLGMSLYHPCNVNIEGADYLCGGTYEMKDDNGDTALQVTLTVTDDIDSYGWIGILAFLSPALCCCAKFCCCGKSGSKKDSSEEEAEDAAENAATDAAPTQIQYVSEPARPGPRERVEPPPFPTVSPSAPLINDFDDSQPPSYEEAMGLTAQTGGSSEFSPAPPVRAEATSSDVYTSDKPNFNNHQL